MAEWIDRELIERRAPPLSLYIADALVSGCSLEKGSEAKRLKATVLTMIAEDGFATPSEEAWKTALRRARS